MSRQQSAPIIGLELHIQLNTESKLFCSCKNQYGAIPNTNICPVCMGLPGSLPVLNREAVKKAVIAGLALNAAINTRSSFSRKNYFYPDLPKGYQITQYDCPLCTGGFMPVSISSEVKEIRIRRIHLEEDAGRSIHTENETLLDFNRCGVPLIEIVTEPDINSPSEARLFLQQIQRLMTYLEISECSPEEGSLRCDANISLRSMEGEIISGITEIKNLNTFKGVERALEWEMERLRAETNKKGKSQSETRMWDEKQKKTILLRRKEEEPEYRYFPEPDLLPLELESEWIDSLKTELTELPHIRKDRFMEEYHLHEKLADLLVNKKSVAEFFEKTISYGGDPSFVAQWITRDVFHYLNKGEKSIPEHFISADDFSRFCRTVQEGSISAFTGKELLKKAFEQGVPLGELIDRELTENERSEQDITVAVEGVLKRHPAEIKRYKEGKTAIFNFFMGLVMRELKGRVSAERVRRVLGDRLKKY